MSERKDWGNEGRAGKYNFQAVRIEPQQQAIIERALDKHGCTKKELVIAGAKLMLKTSKKEGKKLYTS